MKTESITEQLLESITSNWKNPADKLLAKLTVELFSHRYEYGDTPLFTFTCAEPSLPLKQLTSLDVNVKIGTSTTSMKIEW